MLKNKKAIAYCVIGVVGIAVIAGGIFLYKNKYQNKEIGSANPVIENTIDKITENSVEDINQTTQSENVTQLEQENKEAKNSSNNTTKSSNETNPVTTNNPKKEVATTPKKEDTTINNKPEVVEQPKVEMPKPTPTVPEPPKQEETKPVKKEEFKPNMAMANQMVEIIKANPSQFMNDYGYSVVIDKSIIEQTNQFTFTKQRVIDKISKKAGTIKVYAQDYYVDGKLVWTECYLI